MLDFSTVTVVLKPINSAEKRPRTPVVLPVPIQHWYTRRKPLGQVSSQSLQLLVPFGQARAQSVQPRVPLRHNEDAVISVPCSYHTLRQAMTQPFQLLLPLGQAQTQPLQLLLPMGQAQTYCCCSDFSPSYTPSGQQAGSRSFQLLYIYIPLGQARPQSCQLLAPVGQARTQLFQLLVPLRQTRAQSFQLFRVITLGTGTPKMTGTGGSLNGSRGLGQVLSGHWRPCMLLCILEMAVHLKTFQEHKLCTPGSTPPTHYTRELRTAARYQVCTRILVPSSVGHDFTPDTPGSKTQLLLLSKTGLHSSWRLELVVCTDSGSHGCSYQRTRLSTGVPPMSLNFKKIANQVRVFSIQDTGAAQQGNRWSAWTQHLGQAIVSSLGRNRARHAEPRRVCERASAFAAVVDQPKRKNIWDLMF